MTATTLLMVGLVLALAIFIRFGFERIGIPPLVGYFTLGIIALLFRIGLIRRIGVLADRMLFERWPADG